MVEGTDGKLDDERPTVTGQPLSNAPITSSLLEAVTLSPGYLASEGRSRPHDAHPHSLAHRGFAAGVVVSLAAASVMPSEPTPEPPALSDDRLGSETQEAR